MADIVDELKVLHALLRAIRSSDGKVLAALEPPHGSSIFGVRGLSARSAYFLLEAAQPDESDVETFVTRTLARLQRQLQHRTERRLVTHHGRAPGRVNWVATLKARTDGEPNPASFVCQQARHQFDTLENQLLKFVVSIIHECLTVIPAGLREGHCYPLESLMGAEFAPQRTADRLGRIQLGLNAFMLNARLHEVKLPATITPEHLACAEGSRMHEYRAVARVYRQYQSVVHSPDSKALVGIGERVLPMPNRADDSGVAWVELGAAILRQSQT
jgi:hypothetical protein